MDSNLKRLVAKGFIWNAISVFGYRVIGLIIFIVLARLFAPEAFGLVAISFVYIAFVNIFLEQGFSEAIIQQKEISSELLDTAFWTNLIIGFMLVFLSWFLAPLIASLFKEQELVNIVRTLAVLFPIYGLIAVPIAQFRREFDFQSLAYASLFGATIAGTIAILLAYQGWGVWSIVFYQIASKAIEAAVIWVKNPWMPSFQFNFSCLKTLFFFGANVTGSRLLTYVNRYGADCIIGLFLGAVYVGYFNVALRFIRTLVDITGSVVSKVSFSLFSRLQQDPEKGRRYLYQIIRAISSICIPLYVFLLVYAKEIVTLVFNDQWAPAIPLIQILVFIGILNSISFVNNTVLLGYGKPDWRLYLDALNAVVSLAAFLIAVQFGIVEVALALVLRGYLLFPVSYYLISKLMKLNINEYCLSFAPALLSTSVMGLAIWGYQFFINNFFSHLSVTIMSLAMAFIIGLTTYAFSMIMFFPEFVSNLRSIFSSFIFEQQHVDK